jgi:hypothetical protein
MSPEKRRTNQLATAGSSTSNLRQETHFQSEIVSNPTANPAVASGQSSVSIAVAESTVSSIINSAETIQPISETVQDKIDPMKLDSLEVPAISIAVPSQTEALPQLDDATLKELNNPGFTYILKCIMTLYKSLLDGTTALHEVKQSISLKILEFCLLRTKIKSKAQNYKDIPALLSSRTYLSLLRTPARHRPRNG